MQRAKEVGLSRSESERASPAMLARQGPGSGGAGASNDAKARADVERNGGGAIQSGSGRAMKKKQKKKKKILKPEKRKDGSGKIASIALVSDFGYSTKHDVLLRDDYTVSIRKAKVLLPTSALRAGWTLVAMIGLLWTYLVIPLRIAFAMEPSSLFWGLLAVDWIFDFFFLLDMYLYYTAFAFLKDSRFVQDAEKIRRNYMSGRFVYDAIAMFPFEIFALAAPWNVPHKSNVGRVALLSILRIPKLLRIFTSLSERKTNFERFLHKVGYRFQAAMVTVYSMLVLQICVNHVFACLWFIIHRFLNVHAEFTWATKDTLGGTSLSNYNATTGMHDVLAPDHTAVEAYIRAFYFVITVMSTVGYGDIRPYTNGETIFQLVVVLVGACIFAGIIGSWGGVFKYNDSTGLNAFKRKQKMLAEYMSYRDLPEQLKFSITNHYQAMWNRHKCLDERVLLAELPVSLQMSIAHYVKKPLLQAIPLFSLLDTYTQERFAMQLIPQVCREGDFLFRQGDIGREVFFILEGKVKLTYYKEKSRTDSPGGGAASPALARRSPIGGAISDRTLGGGGGGGGGRGRSGLPGRAKKKKDVNRSFMAMNSGSVSGSFIMAKENIEANEFDLGEGDHFGQENIASRSGVRNGKAEGGFGGWGGA